MITIICGPTAVGKTAFAIKKALEEEGEIINADSGQVYRGLDIGTAKPPPNERRVPFHLIDILNPSDRFSAADFRRLALQKISEIQGRRKKVLVVGGTGLYLRVLENGIFEGPSADPEVRKRLGERIQKEGVGALLRDLEKVDPAAAKKMDRRNQQRIIRALEVYELTGRPISSFWSQTGLTCLTGPTKFKKIGLTLPWEELNQRINARVEEMIKSGWIDETEVLLKKWGPDAPALQIIGYKELVAYLRGKGSREVAIEKIKIHTRQYAKRQMTWFRKDRSIQWFDVSSNPLTTRRPLLKVS